MMLNHYLPFHSRINKSRLCTVALSLLVSFVLLDDLSAAQDIIGARNGKEFLLAKYVKTASEVAALAGVSWSSSDLVVSAKQLFWLDLRDLALQELYQARGIVVSETEARQRFDSDLKDFDIAKFQAMYATWADALEEVVSKGKDPIEVFRDTKGLAESLGTYISWERLINQYGNAEGISLLRSPITASAEQAFEKDHEQIIETLKYEKLRDLLLKDTDITPEEVEEYRKRNAQIIKGKADADIKRLALTEKKERLFSTILDEQARNGLVIHDKRFQ